MSECSQITPQESSIKGSTLSLQTAWTGFNPYLYSGGSSLAGSTLVEIANCKLLYSKGALCAISSFDLGTICYPDIHVIYWEESFDYSITAYILQYISLILSHFQQCNEDNKCLSCSVCRAGGQVVVLLWETQLLQDRVCSHWTN